jgi:hypothetical protein
MNRDEVIQILGKPSSISMSDGSGLYWSYRTDYPFALIDDQPEGFGHLLLQTDYDGRVIKVFDFK